MWKPYLQVIATKASQALHVLDRFHIASHMNKAIDRQIPVGQSPLDDPLHRSEYLFPGRVKDPGDLFP
jgi:hypothetical protein